MLNSFPTQFCLQSRLNSFLLCRSHLVPHWLGCASTVPVGRKGGWVSGHWKGLSSRSPGQLSQPLDIPRPLCQVPSALSFGVWWRTRGSEALWCSCPKTTGPAVTFWTWHPCFLLDSQPHGRPLCNSPGAACVQVLPTVLKWFSLK